MATFTHLKLMRLMVLMGGRRMAAAKRKSAFNNSLHCLCVSLHDRLATAASCTCSLIWSVVKFWKYMKVKPIFNNNSYYIYFWSQTQSEFCMCIGLVELWSFLSYGSICLFNTVKTAKQSNSYKRTCVGNVGCRSSEHISFSKEGHLVG